MKECITNTPSLLLDACSKIISKYFDFVDIKSLINMIKNSGIEYMEPHKLLEGIEKIQYSLPSDAIDVKSEFILYLSEQLKNKSLVLKKLSNTAISLLNKQKFVIYGAGIVAKDLYKIINNKGLLPNAFLVTSIKENESQEIDGIPIITAESYCDKNILVFVCVSLKYQNEITDHLFTLGYSHVYVYAD